MCGEEWTDWIMHDGKGCPCVGMFVHVVYGESECGLNPADFAGGWGVDDKGAINNAEWVGLVGRYGYKGSWVNDPEYFPVWKYRIRRPKALQEMIERAKGLDVTVKEDA